MRRVSCLVALAAVAAERCGTPPPACDGKRTGVVHVTSSKAVWGLHSNYYHWLFGRLLPLFHWFETSRPAPGDAVVVEDADDRALETWTDAALDAVATPATCVTGRLRHLDAAGAAELGSSDVASRARTRAERSPADSPRAGAAASSSPATPSPADFPRWPRCRRDPVSTRNLSDSTTAAQARTLGLDGSMYAAEQTSPWRCSVLREATARRCKNHRTRSSSRRATVARYGCDSFGPREKRALAAQLASAKAFMERSCGCCGRDARRPNVIVARRATNQARTKRKRTLPNLPEVVEALREAAPAWAADLSIEAVDVREVEFSELDLCGQWCLAAEAHVVVGESICAAVTNHAVNLGKAPRRLVPAQASTARASRTRRS